MTNKYKLIVAIDPSLTNTGMYAFLVNEDIETVKGWQSSIGDKDSKKPLARRFDTIITSMSTVLFSQQRLAAAGSYCLDFVGGLGSNLRCRVFGLISFLSRQLFFAGVLAIHHAHPTLATADGG